MRWKVWLTSVQSQWPFIPNDFEKTVKTVCIQSLVRQHRSLILHSSFHQVNGVNCSGTSRCKIKHHIDASFYTSL